MAKLTSYGVASGKNFTPARVKLHLGCNTDIRQGYINVDRLPGPGIDVATDLNERWPWEDDSIDYIRAYHLFEHLDGPPSLPGQFWCMNEAWRILKPGGELEMEVPSMNGPGGVQDPTHVTFWVLNTFLYFQAGTNHHALYFPHTLVGGFDVCATEGEPDTMGVISITASLTKLTHEEIAAARRA